MAVHERTPVQQRTFSVLVENRFVVLCHVVGLFSARGFNIDSLAVGETEDSTMSRITLVTRGDRKTLEQIKKQLNKLIDVIKVQDLSEEDFIDMELMLLKLTNTPDLDAFLEPILKRYHVHLVDANDKVRTVACIENRENTKTLFEIFKKKGIVEMSQSGSVALSKGPVKD